MPIYMKIDGVSGSVAARPYTGWIELQSCQLGIYRQAAGLSISREASMPLIPEIVVTKSADNASTALFRLALGNEGKKFIIVFVQSPTDVEPYLRLELENTLVSSYSSSGHSGSDLPMESLSLNYTKITYVTKDSKQPGVSKWK